MARILTRKSRAAKKCSHGFIADFSPTSSLGCEACKPTLGSIIASLFNKHIIDGERRGLQDTNDRFLGNIQRNGTFSVIPRVSGGEITADKLIVIGKSTRLPASRVTVHSGPANPLFFV